MVLEIDHREQHTGGREEEEGGQLPGEPEHEGGEREQRRRRDFDQRGAEREPASA